MLVEFTKRIANLNDAIADREKFNVNDAMTHRLRGALEECERLKAFYESQMVATGRIVPKDQLEVT